MRINVSEMEKGTYDVDIMSRLHLGWCQGNREDEVFFTVLAIYKCLQKTRPQGQVTGDFLGPLTVLHCATFEQNIQASSTDPQSTDRGAPGHGAG